MELVKARGGRLGVGKGMLRSVCEDRLLPETEVATDGGDVGRFGKTET